MRLVILTSSKFAAIAARVIQAPGNTPLPCREWGLICWANSNAGAAAYLQAVGALILIGVVVYQARADHRRKAYEIRTFVDLCRDAVTDVHDTLAPFIEWAWSDGRWDQRFSDLSFFWKSPSNDTLKRILEMPLPQWPALSLYKRMRAIQHTLDTVASALNARIEPDGSLSPTDEVRTRTKALIDAFQEFFKTADKLARRAAPSVSSSFGSGSG
jgi:hypothetical protein